MRAESRRILLRKQAAASALLDARGRTRGHAAVRGVTQLRKEGVGERARGGASDGSCETAAQPPTAQPLRRSRAEQQRSVRTRTHLVNVEAVEARRQAGDRPGHGGACEQQEELSRLQSRWTACRRSQGAVMQRRSMSVGAPSAPSANLIVPVTPAVPTSTHTADIMCRGSGDLGNGENRAVSPRTCTRARRPAPAAGCPCHAGSTQPAAAPLAI